MKHASLHSHAGHVAEPKHMIVLWLIAYNIRYNIKCQILNCALQSIFSLFTTTLVS